MKQVGILHSACYEKQRRSTKEFLLCIGRADCAAAKKQGSIELVGAPEVLESPEGKRKYGLTQHFVGM